jgi:type IV secretory pathway TrbD component
VRPAPHWYRDNRVPTDLRRLVSVAAPNPLVIAWRWRYEIALVSGLAATIVSFGALPAIAAVTGIGLTILCWPMARRFAIDRAWCIITPHRVRAGCSEGLIYSSRGKIPVILWTSHQAFGERVVLWCRAGTSVDDFVSARTVLATACWAQDVAIFFDIDHTQLVTLDVIRRPSADLTSDFEDQRFPDPSGGQPAWPG